MFPRQPGELMTNTGRRAWLLQDRKQGNLTGPFSYQRDSWVWAAHLTANSNLILIVHQNATKRQAGSLRGEQFWKVVKSFYLSTWLLSVRKACALTFSYDPCVVAVCDLIHLTAVSNFPLSLRRTLNIISALIESSLEVDEICSMIPSHGSGE